jgi:hypothetical protein
MRNRLAVLDFWALWFCAKKSKFLVDWVVMFACGGIEVFDCFLGVGGGGGSTPVRWAWLDWRRERRRDGLALEILTSTMGLEVQGSVDGGVKENQMRLRKSIGEEEYLRLRVRGG